jgi:hypothetical protein
MERLSLEQLKINVEGWSRKRGILDQSTYEKQIEKFFEERAELFTTDDPKDAYGDQMVCLINAYLLRGTAKLNSGLGIDSNFYKSASNIESALMAGDIAQAGRALDNEIGLFFDPEECYAIAWNDIKHRVGLMIDGKFVKWDNLTYLQRLDVARSGQLAEPDVDLTYCRSFCTPEEWYGIGAAEQEALEQNLTK